MPIKLTTKAACRVAHIDRDRFNEHVAAGRFPCAPETIPGRARLFDPDDMIGLWLFRELMEDGFDAAKAGQIACAVANAARDNPEAPNISYVQYHTAFNPPGGKAVPSENVLHPSKWDISGFGLDNIRKITLFRVSELRKIIAHYTDEERNIVGERDE